MSGQNSHALPTPQLRPQQEGEWLQKVLQRWLDNFSLKPVNRLKLLNAGFLSAWMEGENDLGSLVMAIVTEMQRLIFQKLLWWLRSPMRSTIYS